MKIIKENVGADKLIERQKIKLIIFVLILLTIIIFVYISIRPRNKEVNSVSTYIWNTEKIVDYSDEYLSFCELKGVNEIYLQVNDNVEREEYQSFIKKANKSGIRVYALGGDPNWTTDEGVDKYNKYIDWIAEYQKSTGFNEKFAGVHLDIEPYLLAEDKYSNYNQILENYQDILIKTSDFCAKNNISLMVVIPFWFNELEYNTIYGYGNVAEWVISHIDTTVIMAYRNKADEENGILKLIDEEITYAEKYNANIIIAVETMKSNEGNFISFFGFNEAYMFEELKKITDVVGDNKSFKGYSIHYLDTWMEMQREVN